MSKYYNEQNDNVSEIDVPQYGKILLYQGKNIVSFVHPTYQKHEVLCQNIEDVIKWIGYHVREERQNNKELDIGKFFSRKKENPEIIFYKLFSCSNDESTRNVIYLLETPEICDFF